jgi:cyclase
MIRQNNLLVTRSALVRSWRSLAAKALAVVIFICLLSTVGRAEPGGVQKLAEGVYAWQGEPDKGILANCLWVIFKDYVVVVDANYPWGAQEIIPQIKKTTDKPIRFVLNTHHHGDHSFGNSEFTKLGAIIINSEATDSEARSRGDWARWNRTDHSLKEFHQEFANLTFSDRLVFDDGTQRVEMIRLGPAHTKGDVVAYLPKQHIVATGDLCVTWGIGNNVGDSGASYAGWLDALDRMYSWNLTTVVPGHGATGGPEILKAQKAYLAGMLQQVQDGYKAGKTADELVKEIDLKKYGFIASDAAANASSIRNMYRHVSAKAP